MMVLFIKRAAQEGPAYQTHNAGMADLPDERRGGKARVAAKWV